MSDKEIELAYISRSRTTFDSYINLHQANWSHQYCTVFLLLHSYCFLGLDTKLQARVFPIKLTLWWCNLIRRNYFYFVYFLFHLISLLGDASIFLIRSWATGHQGIHYIAFAATASAIIVFYYSIHGAWGGFAIV